MESPDHIIEKLNIYKEKYFSMLDDFSNSYINYKLYPGYSEHENIYSNNKGNLESIQANVFMTTNDIQQSIDTLNNYIAELNNKLSKEKSDNSDLQKQLSDIDTSSDGSSLLIGESSDLYKYQRITNIGMAIGIFSILVLLFKIYSKPPQV